MKLINRQELQKWFENRSCNNNNKFSSSVWNQDLKQTFNFSVTFCDDNISINHSVHWIDSQNTYLLITMCVMLVFNQIDSICKYIYLAI